MLSDPQLADLRQLRRALHAAPELSGEERETAVRLRDFLLVSRPDLVIEGLGGHGLAVIYEGQAPGPCVMFRAELDALPIDERSAALHASRSPGIAHLCGHDGHMAVLAGLGLWLGGNRPARGRVILLFQPAEETGAGARAVVADPKFADLRSDWAFAMHNMPGLALGALAVGEGPASCASVGLQICYEGREAHASMPETGNSPAPALAALMAALDPVTRLAPMGPEFRLATLCHLSMGVPAFGISPGQAEARVTLRTVSDAALEAFEAEIIAKVQASAQDIGVSISRHDHFNATLNDPQAAEFVARAGRALGLARAEFALPIRASEDFGAFSVTTRTALFFLGAGEGHAALHNPDYDFPDTLIAPGCELFVKVLEQVI